MSIADKLTTIAENEQKVYDAGYEAGKQSLQPQMSELETEVEEWKTAYEEKSSINPEWTDWRYFSYYDNRNDLVAKLKYSDTSNGKDFQYMFAYCSTLTTIPPSLNTSNGTQFDSMFRGCSALTKAPLLDVYNGWSFAYMFYGCSNLTEIPMLNFSDTNIGCMTLMFNNCDALTKIGFEGTIKVNTTSSSFLTKATNVNQESLHKLIDCFMDNSTLEKTYRVGIGSTNLARISADYLEKAAAKNITLQ